MKSNKELKKHEVKFETLDYYQGSLDEVEKFINKYRTDIENNYKYNLTQSQDITKWINDSKTIDKKIIENLRDLIKEMEIGAKENKIPNEIKFLDVGCYCGYIYKWIKDNIKTNMNIKYVGVDIREDAIESAREIFKNDKNSSFYQCDVFDIKTTFRPKEFDVVFCSRTLTHLPSFEIALKNLIYTTKHLLFLVNKIGKTDCKLNKKIDLTAKNEFLYFYRCISTEDLKNLAISNQADLKIIKRKDYSSIIFNLRGQ